MLPSRRWKKYRFRLNSTDVKLAGRSKSDSGRFCLCKCSWCKRYLDVLENAQYKLEESRNRHAYLRDLGLEHAQMINNVLQLMLIKDFVRDCILYYLATSRPTIACNRKLSFGHCRHTVETLRTLRAHWPRLLPQSI